MRAATTLVLACMLLPSASALDVDADVQVPVGVGASVGANVAGNVHGAVGLVGTGLSSAACNWVVALNSILAAYASSDNLALATDGAAATSEPVSLLSVEPAATGASTANATDAPDADVTLATQRSVIDADVGVDGGSSHSRCSSNLTNVRINATLADGFGLPPPTMGDTMALASTAALEELAGSTIGVDAQVPIGVDAAVSANVLGNVVLDVDALVMGSSLASCNAIVAANTQMLASTTSRNHVEATRGGASTGMSLTALEAPDVNATLPNATLPNATLPNATLPALPNLPDLSLLGLLGLPDILVDVEVVGADTTSVCETRIDGLEINAGVATTLVSATTTQTR